MAGLPRIAVDPRPAAAGLAAAGLCAATACVFLALRNPGLAFVPAGLLLAGYVAARAGTLPLLLAAAVILIGVDVRVLEGSLMSFSLAEIALLGALTAFLVCALRDRRPIRAPAQAPLMIFLVAYMVLSNLFAVNVTHYLSETRNWIMAFLLLFVLSNAAEGREDRARLALIFIAACDAFAVMGLLQSFLGMSTFTANPEMASKRGFLDAIAGGEAEKVSAAVGLTTHSNGLGRLLAMALPLCTLLALDGRAGRGAATRAFAALSIPLMGVALFVTYSKGAMLTCVVTLGLVWLAAGRGVPLKAMVAALVSLVGAAVAFYFVLDLLDYRGLTGTMAFRLDLWGNVFGTLASHPLVFMFGNGQELFGAVAQYDQPHNAYLFFLLQHGFVSTVLILTLLGALLAGLQRASAGAPDSADRRMAAGALALALGFLTGELVESMIMGVTMKMLLFFLIWLGMLQRSDDVWPRPSRRQVNAGGSLERL